MGFLGDILDDVVSIPEKAAELVVETVKAPVKVVKGLDEIMEEIFGED